MILLVFFLITESPTIVVKKFDRGIKLDGIISKEEWGDFTPLTDFYEFQPEEDKIPPVKTELYIGYDKSNLYVAVKCYDNVQEIRKTLTKRDMIAMDDMIFIFLDTYGKCREGYIFGTNPLSVQYDGIKGPPPSNVEDYNFDTEWFVKSFIGRDFWSCEFKIPFSSLRFKSKEKQEWRILVMRVRPRGSLETYSFPKLSLSNPAIFEQGAILIIPEKIVAKEKKLSLLPFLISSHVGTREDGDYVNSFKGFDAGISGRYRLAQNLIIDFALNPDYSQIETDIPQIDVNTIFALYYPEKRPFFMEGAQIIKMPIKLIYTRMINNPLYAIKLTGRVSNFDVYFLSAYDENLIYIVPFEDYSFKLPTYKKGFTNLLRFKMDLPGRESYIGFLLGNRWALRDSIFDNGYGSVFGIDAKIRFLKHYTIKYQGALSYTKESEDSSLFSGFGFLFDNHTDKFDGEKFSGNMNCFSFNSFFKNFWLSLWYRELSPTFRSDFGYIAKNGYKNYGISMNPIFYLSQYGIDKLTFGVEYEREVNFSKELKKKEISFDLNVCLPYWQTNLEIEQSFYDKKYFEYFEGLYDLSASISAFPLKWLQIATGFNTGKTIYYSEIIPAYEKDFYINGCLKLEKLLLGLMMEREVLYRKKYKDLIYDVKNYALSQDYSFTNTFSYRLILFYYTGQEIIGIYPLFTYQLNPFTVFYFGANVNALKHPEKIEFQEHQIFLKFRYLFKI